MPYECSLCPEFEPARFVFTDLDTGSVAASCAGHALDFLATCMQITAKELGIDLDAVAAGENVEQDPPERDEPPDMTQELEALDIAPGDPIGPTRNAKRSTRVVDTETAS